MKAKLVKSLAVMTMAVMMAGALAGCGSSTETTTDNTDTEEVTEDTADTTEDVAVEVADDAVSTSEEYDGGTFTFTYDPSSLYLTEDAGDNQVQLSYNKEGVDAAGSNVVMMRVAEDTDYKSAMDQLVTMEGYNADDVNEVSLQASDEALSCIKTDASDETEIKIVSTIYTIKAGDNTLIVESMRTVGPDEGTEMTIDSAFEEVMQTLALK